MIWGALTAFGIYLIFHWPRLKRAPVELIPNCLLTRYPICFVSGRRSLFYHLRYFNDCPRYLREHGYEVIELQSLKSLKETLKIHKKVHVICLEQDFQNQREQYEQLSNQIASFSFLEDPDCKNLSPYPIGSFFLRPVNISPTRPLNLIWKCHQLWSQTRVDCRQLALPGPNALKVHRSYLEHFIAIAEKDWMDMQ